MANRKFVFAYPSEVTNVMKEHGYKVPSTHAVVYMPEEVCGRTTDKHEARAVTQRLWRLHILDVEGENTDWPPTPEAFTELHTKLFPPNAEA